MPRYALHIEYDGTHYSGWQVQPNAPTIQEEIEKALSVIIRKPVSVTGSGRTDAGVHARGQVAHLDIDTPIDKGRILQSLFGLLPRDIAVYDISEVPDDFHARFDAKTREYRYYFATQPIPLLAHCTAYWWHELDTTAMRKAAGFLTGDTDCTSFTPADPEQPHLRCLIYAADITEGNEREPHYFTIKANRFLRSVVRSVMGTLIEVGKGKMTPEEFNQLIVHPDRSAAGTTAPAKGLVLHKVTY